jgi:hypothetical protein
MIGAGAPFGRTCLVSGGHRPGLPLQKERLHVIPLKPLGLDQKPSRWSL